MKAIVCEMCGSQDLVKQNDVYVCQSCGTKYSVEEAKKLMVEVEGKVKIDHSEELESLYRVARRAKDDNNSENAAKYYDMIAVKDPDSWEASFYVVYFNAMGCKIANIQRPYCGEARRGYADRQRSKTAAEYRIRGAGKQIQRPIRSIADAIPAYIRATVFDGANRPPACGVQNDPLAQSAAISVANCLDTVFKLIKEHVEDRSEQIKAVKEVADRSSRISGMLYDAAKNHYNNINIQIRTKYTQEMLNNCIAARDIRYLTGNYIDTIFEGYEELHAVAVEAWKAGIIQHNALMLYFANKDINEKAIMGYVSQIQKYDSSYQAPVFKKAGCYVATAVYGSYDCPQVWTLRRYRDTVLAETWHGRLFIRFYYAISPTLVKWFGDSKWFKNMWKPKLDRMVSRLKSEGMKDTPYQDRNW